MVERYGEFDPLQGGTLGPQILLMPSFSIMIMRTWSKKAPWPGFPGGGGESAGDVGPEVSPIFVVLSWAKSDRVTVRIMNETVVI